MGPFIKKVVKAQGLEQSSSSSEDSESVDNLKSSNPKNANAAKSSAGNLSVDHTADDTSSSDDFFSDTQSSDNDIKNDEVRAMKVVSLSSNDDLVVSLSRKRQEKDLKNQAGNTLQHGTSDSDDDSDAESRKEILRSAEKRIIRKVSTSESDSRNKRVVRSEKSTSSSDSDSAPENVTFEAGRKKAMEVFKQRVDSIHQEKLRKKEQRKKKLENFKKQKEEKLLRLKQRQRNTENVSSSSCAELASKSKPAAKQHARTSEDKSVLGKKTYFSSESDDSEKKADGVKSDKKHSRNLKRLPASILDSLPDQVTHRQQKPAAIVENEDDCIQSKKRRSKVNNSELQWDTDYIPLDGSSVTQFGVVPLNTVRKKSVAEEAAAFRQNMLYGSAVRRTPANLNAIRQQKLKICGMDRLVTPHVQ